MWQGPRPRSEVLAAYREVLDVLDLLERPLRDWSFATLEQTEYRYIAEQSRLTDAYLAGCGPVPVSRCPFTGEPVTLPVDTDGLDGMWWDYHAAVRPWWPRPPTLLSLSGGMRLAQPLEDTRWLVCPGPDRPYVIPRLLATDSVRAVLSTVPVGVHTGYVIAYFAPETTQGVTPANDWGAAEARGLGSGSGWFATYDDPAGFDFDLAPWLQSGRLQWIEAGDAGLTLRRDDDGPYAGADASPGSRWQRVERGTVR